MIPIPIPIPILLVVSTVLSEERQPLVAVAVAVAEAVAEVRWIFNSQIAWDRDDIGFLLKISFKKLKCALKNKYIYLY